MKKKTRNESKAPPTRPKLLAFGGSPPVACRVPDAVARAIHERCILQGQPYLNPPKSPREALYAVEQGDGYVLHLGPPCGDPAPPTWREYLRRRGVDAHDREAVVKWFCKEQEMGRKEVPTINPDAPIDGHCLRQWIDWDLPLHESPEARAYRYLDGLQLGDGSNVTEGEVMGRVDFVEGAEPGSNYTYVQASDLAAVACLQHRLNELNESVEIRMD